MSQDNPTIELSTLRSHYSGSAVAYFCSEFAINDDFPIYAGGLGILAGDILLQADEQKKPMIAVGLMYHTIVNHQQISKEANESVTLAVDPAKVGLQQLVENGSVVTIEIPLHSRKLTVSAYVLHVGTIPLVLLDTHTPSNTPDDQSISDALYAGDSEHRLKQEIVLGIAGAKMLSRIGVPIDVYHSNEGHSALLIFELLRQLSKQHPSEDIESLRTHLPQIVFTNHTLIPAGNDVFPKELLLSYLTAYAQEFPIDVSRLISYGLIADSSLFSPTLLALRLATKRQAVSILHAKKAQEIWPDYPMIAITNGVYQKRWQVPELFEKNIEDMSDQEIWDIHMTHKTALREYIRETTGTVWERDGLILAWSRRLASYKRPLLFWEDRSRIEKILSDPARPVTILISGKPHARDESAKQNLRELLRIVGESGGRVVYVQNYSLTLAQMILSGSDVLVNTPIRGMEACGTSGMKASLNGVLQCTTLDGWTDEVKWQDVGWELPDAQTSAALYDTLESSIIPLFADKNAWITRMRKTILIAQNHYTTARVLSELEKMAYNTNV